MEKSSIRVLIVEDNPADARLVSEMLKECSTLLFKTAYAGRLDEALKILKEKKFDVVLLDLNLPDSQGLNGVERITAQELEVPVIILTGLDDETLGLQAVQKHAEDYLVKGQINLNILVRSIRYAIERKRAEQTLRQRTFELRQMTVSLEQRVQERTAELAKANATLRDLSSRLLSAHEDERKKIAGDLHDTIGACLNAIKYKIDILQLSGNDSNVTEEFFSGVIPVIQECTEECRRIQQALRPSMLDDLGLLTTLSWFCRRYQTIYTGIKVELKQTLEEKDIPDSLKIVIFRVTQEGMNNIAKHSKADFVHLSLQKMDGRIELVLEDNGQGFDLKKVLGVESTKRGFGLTSMRERSELSGGSFVIESAEGKGTTIRASWPF